jgi:hypothetical protein
MMRRSQNYYVCLQGIWTKADSYEHAVHLEAADATARINAARNKGLRVITICTPGPPEPKRDRARVVFAPKESSSAHHL